MKNLCNNINRGIVSMQASAIVYTNAVKEKLSEQDGSVSSEMAFVIVGAIMLVGIGFAFTNKTFKEQIAPGISNKVTEFFNFS